MWVALNAIIDSIWQYLRLAGEVETFVDEALRSWRPLLFVFKGLEIDPNVKGLVSRRISGYKGETGA